MQDIRLILVADLQVKNRTYNLANSYQLTCEEVEEVVIDTKADIIVHAGDMLEYPSSNDSERKIMYNHFSNLLNIHSLKELVVINGNHDIDLSKKKESLIAENNPLDTYYNMSKVLSPERASKLNYLKLQKEYKSIASENISWISYSLEDGTSSGSNLNLTSPVADILRIPVFHDILKEYVDDKKLPVSKSKYDHLMEMDKFPNESPFILAGDIHERWTHYKNNRTFVYPGSTVQRNHGEGSYLKIRKNPIITKAAPKYVLQIDIKFNSEDITKSTFDVVEIPLKNTLHYITLDFNTKTFVDNWKEQLEDGLLKLEVSRNTNIFKLSISNVYMKYEMDILTIINKFFESQQAKYQSANYLELSYGQIVFDSEDELIENEISEASENDSEEFDIEEENIVLNTDKLKIIFSKVVDNYSKSILKEFSNPEEFQEVIEEINSLFAEQIELFYGNKHSYSIELDKITTNGFMALGYNEIDLDIPGLTRIVGNNGIGKTTLYNMLRWTIKNMVIEGLPKNTKKENLLLVFNDELIDQDKIHTKLESRVNNTPVIIERFANRTWKKSASDLDKQSKNWKDFIDTVTSTLKVTILPEGKEPIIKLNDEAQGILDVWFGNVPENIMILNQYKILQLLNSSGNALNEMVLEFAGVDYLKSLEENLDIVKSKYQVAKPDKSQMDIVVEKNKIAESLDKNNKTINENQEKIQYFESQLTVEKNNLEIKLQEKVNIGNVPEKIKNIENDLKIEKEKKENFKFQEIQELPIFNEEKPVKPDTFDLQQKIEINETVISDDEIKLQSIINQFNEGKQEKLETINNHQNKLDNEILLFTKNKKEEFDKNTSELIELIKTDKINIFNHWNKIYNYNIVELKNDLKLERENESKLIQNKNTKVTRSSELQKIIDSGICQSCLRPLENAEEKIKQAKTDLLEIQEEIKLLNNDLSTLREKIIKIENNISLEETKSKDFSRLISWNSNLTSKIEIENELNLLNSNLKIFNQQLIEKYKELIELYNNFESIKNDEYIISREKNIDKFIKLKNILATLSLQTEITEELKKVTFLSTIFELVENHKNYENKIKLNKEELKTFNQQLKHINDTFNDKLTIYNNNLTTHNNTVNSINQSNSEVNKHNQQITIINSNIERLEKDLETTNQQKYEYEKVNNSYNEINEKVTELDENIKDKTKTNNNLSNANNLMNQNLELLNDLENKWKDYRKKNFIYKTFEKLIKKDFKHAIFNFYRQFLNNKLNILLEGLDFRLFWNSDSALYMIKFTKNHLNETETVYRPVKLASGMQTAFLGLSMIYTIHLLNVRNSISHIFIDEISGQLNSGKNSVNEDDLTNSESKNYQEQLVFLLNKFTKKKIFIIDHVINNFYETKTLQVKRELIDGKKLSFYSEIY